MIEREDPLLLKTRPVRVIREIDTRFSRDCKNANLEEEEANHDRTVRPVVSRQPAWFVLNEVDIDFTVSWIATCSCENKPKFSCS